MAFNLKEYIIYRNEIKRELFNGEVDENFKAVANPWVDNRTYDNGHIVYHPVEVLEPTGSTSVVTETLVWWRANRRTTQGVFVTAEWDIIGGIGTGDVTVGSSNGYGRIVVNYTGATPALAASNDFTLNSTIPNDVFRLIAGDGVQLQYDSTVNAIKLINSSAGGEINQGLNIGIGTGVQNLFSGMSGTTLTFRGLNASNTDSSLGEALALGLNSPNKSVVYNFDSSFIDLATLNNNNTNINSLGNVNASSAAVSEFLQYDGNDWVNVTAAAAGLLGSQGVTGTQGLQGLQGNDGFGLQGTIGAQGIQGTLGIQGLQGIEGFGLQGTQGVQGEASTIAGQTGSQGVQGTDGFGLQGTIGAQGALGAQGLKGDQGGFGGASFDYQFNTTTIVDDPGFSYISVNNTDQYLANIISINDFGITGNNISTFLETIKSSTSVPKGHVRITSQSDANEFILWQITEVYDRPSSGGTWWELDVVPVAYTENAPFIMDEDVLVSFVVTGDRGATGSQGTTGSQGVQGIQGLDGSQGVQGAQGLQGLQGSGSQGVQGLQGLDGSQGVQGVQGLQGLGSQGVQGVQGIDGSGSQGVQGLSGSISGSVAYGSMILSKNVGTINLSGASYEGLLLDAGELNQMTYVVSAGTPQGNVLSIDAGEAGDYEINFTFSGVIPANQDIFTEIFVNGSPYGVSGLTEFRTGFTASEYNTMSTVDILDLNDGDQVEIRVKTSAPVTFTISNISLTLVKLIGNGQPGTQGTQGVQGISGSGSQGTQGLQGLEGLQGSKGLQGIQGLDGSQGTQGLQGLDGSQGTQGLQGLDGSQGTKGENGTQGTQGLQGLDGSQGTQGLLGVQGVQGTNGNTGSQGTIGRAGIGSGCILGNTFGWSSVVNTLVGPGANEINMSASTTGSVTTIYIGTSIIHPVTLNVGDTISLNVSTSGIDALYTVNSITGNIGYDALDVTFQTGNYTIGSSSGGSGPFISYTYCIYPAPVAGTQGTQGLEGSQGTQGLLGVQGVQGKTGKDNGCFVISGTGSPNGYLSQQFPPTNNNQLVSGNVVSGGFTNNITKIWLGTITGASQPSGGLPVGSTISLTGSSTTFFSVDSVDTQTVFGFLYNVTHISGNDLSTTGNTYTVCTAIAGVQGVQGLQGLLGIQGTTSSEIRREIVKSSFRSKTGLPRYTSGDPANSSFRIGGMDTANLVDAGGWNSAYWGPSSSGDGVLTGVSGTQDQFALMGNGVALTKNYAVNDIISFRGVIVGQRTSAPYSAPTTVGINLYKLKCGILGDGTNEWETIATAPISTSNVVYETTAEGEGRGRLCINATFLLNKTVDRFTEYLAVGFAASADDDGSFGGNDIIVSYLLFEDSDPQP